MLKEITFINFRCFERHAVPLDAITIAVGQNNAGKSTFVGGLRLIALVRERFRNLNFNAPPKWLSLPSWYRGVSPSVENLNINFPTICYRYGDPPAQVAAIFENDCKIEVYLHLKAAYMPCFMVLRITSSIPKPRRAKLPTVD